MAWYQIHSWQLLIFPQLLTIEILYPAFISQFLCLTLYFTNPHLLHILFTFLYRRSFHKSYTNTHFFYRYKHTHVYWSINYIKRAKDSWIVIFGFINYNYMHILGFKTCKQTHTYSISEWAALFLSFFSFSFLQVRLLVWAMFLFLLLLFFFFFF